MTIRESPSGARRSLPGPTDAGCQNNRDEPVASREIPQFRCSDPKFEEIYYYLWAFTHVLHRRTKRMGDGKHTQTAVNNFLESIATTLVSIRSVLGRGTSRARLWKRSTENLVENGRYRETPNGTIMLSDNKGTTWHSGAYGVSWPSMSLARGKFTNIRAIRISCGNATKAIFERFSGSASVALR